MVALAAGVAAGGSIIGGLIGGAGAQSAAKQQADASKYAAQLGYQMYQETKGGLAPYADFGKQNLQDWAKLPGQYGPAAMTAFNQAQGMIPGEMSQEWLAKQPGYQWALSQGEQAVQNSAAARGLGVSGTAMKGAASYATGLAQQYYNTAFQQAQTRFSDYSTQQDKLANMYDIQNKLYQNQASLGESAAATTGQQATQTAGIVSGDINAAGQATAAGTATAASDLAKGLSSASQMPLAYSLLKPSGDTTTAPSPAISGVNTVSSTPATPAMTAAPTNYYAGGVGGPGY